MTLASFENLRHQHEEVMMIRHDIHVKDNFLAIICVNSFTAKKQKNNVKKETVSKHGLGLKIVHNIIKRYHALTDTEYSKDSYKIRIALSLV